MAPTKTCPQQQTVYEREYLLLVEIQIGRIKTNLSHIKLTELIPVKLNKWKFVTREC